MATVTLTPRYANLDNWPGQLFNGEPGSGTTITLRSATEFRARLGDDTGFDGFQVIVTGTGFQYINGRAVEGRMSEVRVIDTSGNTVITFSGLSAHPLSGEFSQFFVNMFGSGSPNAGPSGDVTAAWSHLLAGNDVINGSSGDDWQSTYGYNPGNDTFNGLGGDDWLQGGLGNDTYNGGAGFDALTFGQTTFAEGAAAFRGVTIDVAAGRVSDAWGGTDRFTSIEMFYGSRFDDTYNGSTRRADQFAGSRGDDRIDGGANGFTAGGQRGTDTNDEVRYENDRGDGGRLGIIVDLETSFVGGSIRGTIRDGFGDTDRVIDIEHVVGTSFADRFVGSRMDNQFQGGEGRDSYHGQAGFDTVDFERTFERAPTSGIRVDLTRASGQVQNDGFGNVETMIAIEKVQGGGRNDTIRMDAGRDELEGREGADRLTGGRGSDVFIWDDEEHAGFRDVVTDFTATGPDRDVLGFRRSGFDGMEGPVRIVNGTQATTNQGTFLFNAATDRLVWDENGTGAGGQVLIAVLNGVNSLSTANFDLWD